MKKLYLKQFNGDIQNLAVLDLDKSFSLHTEEEQDNEKQVLIIQEFIGEDDRGNPEYKDHPYRMIEELPKEKDDQGRDKIVSIAGFVEMAKKPDKDSKVKKNDSALMASLYGCIPVLREMPKNHKVIGYIKIQDSDTYIAIIKKKILLLPIILPVVAVAVLIGILSMPNVKSPISLDKFAQGTLGQGDIEIEKSEMQEAQNLRIIMNVNPVLVDGKMNLLIQNNKESNVLSMVAEVLVLNKLDKEGNVIEKYETPMKIAETPLINPGENMENVPVSEGVEIEAGRYDGRVMYTAYKITEEGAMPIGQVAGRINLIVK